MYSNTILNIVTGPLRSCVIYNYCCPQCGSEGPTRPGRFCIPFTDAKPAREMHMRRNLLDGDGRKNCGWRVDLRLVSMDIVKIFPCGNYYRKSYRTLKLFIVHIKLRSYINCDIGTVFIILKSILIIYYYYSGIYIYIYIKILHMHLTTTLKK